MEDMDTTNTKYQTENGRQGYKKYKREWRTWIEEIQNTGEKMDTRKTKIPEREWRTTQTTG